MYRNVARALLLFGIVIGLASAPAVAGKRLIIERIVAVVNGDIILWSEWRQRVDVFKARLGKTLDENETKKRLAKLSKQMLNKMIDDKLLDQHARKKNVSLTEKEVNAAVKDTQKRYKMSDSQFLLALQEQGYTMTTYKAMVRRELKKLRLLQQVLRQKISVSEEEIKKYYADTLRGIKPGPDEYRIRQIIITLPNKPAMKVVAKAKREAENVLKLAKVKQDLASFVGLVKRFSQGPWKNKNGDLGYLEPDSLPQIIAGVAPKMKVNQVYPKLLRSPLGFHIIFLQAIRKSGVVSYAVAKPKIKKKLQNAAFQREYKRFVKQLRRKALIEIRSPTQIAKK